MQVTCTGKHIMCYLAYFCQHYSLCNCEVNERLQHSCVINIVLQVYSLCPDKVTTIADYLTVSTYSQYKGMCRHSVWDSLDTLSGDNRWFPSLAISKLWWSSRNYKEAQHQTASGFCSQQTNGHCLDGSSSNALCFITRSYTLYWTVSHFETQLSS